MNKKLFLEQLDVIAVALFLFLGAVDLLIVWRASDSITDYEAWHRTFQSIFLVGTAGGLVTLVIRWIRQHQELIEAVQVSQHILQNKCVADQVGGILNECMEIRKKQWPEFAEQFLAEELGTFKKNTIHRIATGEIQCSLSFGQTYSPNFFSLYTGTSFATHIGKWDYWRSPNGRTQLDANAHAIRSHRGEIIRYFVLPNNVELPEDEDIQRQLDARITLWIINKGDIDHKFLQDVGVFFNERGEVKLFSVWNESHAHLTLDGNRLEEGRGIYHHFRNKGTATSIKDLKDWKLYKKQELSVSDRRTITQ